MSRTLSKSVRNFCWSCLRLVHPHPPIHTHTHTHTQRERERERERARAFIRITKLDTRTDPESSELLCNKLRRCLVRRMLKQCSAGSGGGGGSGGRWRIESKRRQTDRRRVDGQVYGRRPRRLGRRWQTAAGPRRRRGKVRRRRRHAVREITCNRPTNERNRHREFQRHHRLTCDWSLPLTVAR